MEVGRVATLRLDETEAWLARVSEVSAGEPCLGSWGRLVRSRAATVSTSICELV